jgi:hypothetical protein
MAHRCCRIIATPPLPIAELAKLPQPSTMVSSAQIDDLANTIVARFLRTNAYSETLQAFIREAGLPPDAGQASGDDTHNLTIQSLLEEKRAYDHSVNFERLGNESGEISFWQLPGKIVVVDSSCLHRGLG